MQQLRFLATLIVSLTLLNLSLQSAKAATIASPLCNSPVVPRFSTTAPQVTGLLFNTPQLFECSSNTDAIAVLRVGRVAGVSTESGQVSDLYWNATNSITDAKTTEDTQVEAALDTTPGLKQSAMMVAAEASVSATPEPSVRPRPSVSPKPLVQPTDLSAPSTTPSPTTVPSPTSGVPKSVIATAPAHIEGLINTYAGQYGVDPTMMKLIAQCESGLRPEATNGPYGGMYQFVSSTWVSNRNAMGEDPDPALRFDADAAIKTAAFKMGRDGYGAWPACSRKASNQIAMAQ